MGKLGLRLAFDVAKENSSYQIVHVNEPEGDLNCHAHLLEFDTVHGRWDRNIETDEGALRIENQRVTFSAETDPAMVPWQDQGVELALECSGRFKSAQALAPYFDQGIRKILISAPCPDPAVNIVMGVNQHLYEPDQHHIVTAASCTTNCLAPLVKVMHESVGIVHGTMTTIHDITNTQVILDKSHKDLRRARACGSSLIPTTTGSAKAIIQIFPELKGKLDGLAVRVPLANASLTDFVFESGRKTTAKEINELFEAASGGELAGILGVEKRPLVSTDFKGDPRSSIVDAQSTMVIDGTQIKVLAWYDNEWGYMNRMMELTEMIARSM